MENEMILPILQEELNFDIIKCSLLKAIALASNRMLEQQLHILSCALHSNVTRANIDAIAKIYDNNWVLKQVESSIKKSIDLQDEIYLAVCQIQDDKDAINCVEIDIKKDLNK